MATNVNLEWTRLRGGVWAVWTLNVNINSVHVVIDLIEKNRISDMKSYLVGLVASVSSKMDGQVRSDS